MSKSDRTIIALPKWEEALIRGRHVNCSKCKAGCCLTSATEKHVLETVAIEACEILCVECVKERIKSTTEPIEVDEPTPEQIKEMIDYLVNRTMLN